MRASKEDVSSDVPFRPYKLTRRKCINNSVFAPSFGSNQGSINFAMMHMFFGANNTSNFLLHIPQNACHDIVVNIYMGLKQACWIWYMVVFRLYL